MAVKSQALWVLGALAAGLLVAALLVDVPELSGRRFWSDGATYYAMSLSLARDADLRYEAKDLQRIQEEYPGGPTGLFLKKSAGGLYYAKSLIYPLAGAPLVRVFGGTRGLLVLNSLCFGLSLFLGYGELRRRGISEWSALLVVLGLFVCGVGPLYVWWLTPEVFNFALITLGLVMGSKGRPVWSAVFLGMAIYSKPTNVFLAAPLLLEPLLSWSWGGVLESVRRGVFLSFATLVLFGLNFGLTGEINYQGGERKTFYSKFPYETAESTFETGGIWMSTEHVGPLVAGEDEGKQTVKTGPARSADELRASFVRNLGYFWVGRFGGVLPYFPTFLLGVLSFLAVGGRSVSGWLCLLSLVSSFLFFIWLIPDNWYGGGGTVGNRYFLNLLPLGLYLLPRGREWWVGALGGIAGLGLMGPVLASPVRHSLHPGEHAVTSSFRTFPVELTMLNDLSVFTDTWRKKRPYGDYDLYFLDDGTYGQESSFDIEGFWIRGGRDAEVILAAAPTLQSIRLRVTGGPRGDIVTVVFGTDRRRLVVGALKTEEAVFAARSGVPYYGRSLYRLRLASRFAGGAKGDTRPLGSFVTIATQPAPGGP
jgi:hypothetical protein